MIQYHKDVIYLIVFSKTLYSFYSKLTKLQIELFLNEQNNEELSGNNNSDKRECDGSNILF
jgi:hypothetical protein